MTRLQLLFPKALALHCGPTGIGEAKFGFNPLLLTCLRQSDQQLMTEAPIVFRLFTKLVPRYSYRQRREDEACF
jgi:hypothetical protein